MHPTIAYVHLPTLFKVYYFNCIRYFTLRLFVSTHLVYLNLIIMWILYILFRSLDEVIFLGYRKTRLLQPLFIISSPRSGTTLLQNLLSTNDEKFNSPKLYHVIIPSITFYKLVSGVAYIDNFIERPFKKFLEWSGNIIFKMWEGIHPMGFNNYEEDEGLWFYNFTSPAICMITPYYASFRYLNVYDHLPDSIRIPNTKYYLNTLKRMQYAMGKSRTFLIKSVMSSGRIEEILKTFPDARFIYLERSPLETIPSYISMFSASWKLIAPDAPDSAYKELGKTAIDFYKHFRKARKTKIAKKNLLEINYKDFISDPLKHVEKIYRFLDFEMTEKTKQRIMEQIAQRRHYKSKHSYSLEMFGWTDEELTESLV